MKKKIVAVSLSLVSGIYIQAKVGTNPLCPQRVNVVTEIDKDQKNIKPREVQKIEVAKNVRATVTMTSVENVEKSTQKISETVCKIKNQKNSERTILVSNNITRDMITYKKHWTGHYTPSTFMVKINDKELKNEEVTPIQVKDDTVQLAFTYEFKVFGKVQRAGGRVVTYKIPKNIEKLSSTFSWDAPSNIILNEGCEVVACRDIG